MMKIYPSSTFNFRNTFISLPDVSAIVEEVKQEGDLAVKKFAHQFDGFEGNQFFASASMIETAYSEVSQKFINAVKEAAENIKNFALNQRQTLKDMQVETPFGILGHRIIPIDTVGYYIPGGRFPLPSTALMTIIPAKVAGVQKVIAATPKNNPHVIVAADIAGVDDILLVGGVQAIAALAYGTETIPRVDKIVGPGNKYVSAAKKYVYGDAGIDFIAGPSEVLVIADDTANPTIVAADLLAQAEHDPDARAILLTTSEHLADKVAKKVSEQLENLSTRHTAQQSIDDSAIVLCDSLEQIIELTNAIAPEHLEIQIENPSDIVHKIRNYGSLFIGNQSAEVFGDYCAGPNHTLPTRGAARYTGGLSIFSYLKIVTFQQIMNPKDLIQVSALLASVEGLEGHKKAAEVRKL